MLVILKPGVLVVSAQSAAERQEFAVWQEAMAGHVFRLHASPDGGAMLDLGPREDACRHPINIVYTQNETQWQPISNFALSPFTLRGRPYASVEGFWQGLKFHSAADRHRVAGLWGVPAMRAGQDAPKADTIVYDGAHYPVGAAGHRALMMEACKAKFAQDFAAREALLATGNRPLIHRVRRDSQTIPGALMADIWMRIRSTLRNDGSDTADEAQG